jgi:hypothetical protein
MMHEQKLLVSHERVSGLLFQCIESIMRTDNIFMWIYSYYKKGNYYNCIYIYVCVCVCVCVCARVIRGRQS